MYSSLFYKLEFALFFIVNNDNYRLNLHCDSYSFSIFLIIQNNIKIIINQTQIQFEFIYFIVKIL